VAVIALRHGERAPAAVELDAAAPAPPVAPRPPRWPPPFVLSDLAMAVDRTFAEEQLRVMAVAPLDPEVVRDAYKAGYQQFVAFLRERGLFDGHLPGQPMTVQVVPAEVLCQARIYKEPEQMDAKAPADCATRETWYRPREKTLFVTAEPRHLARNVGYGAAVAICLHTVPRLSGCDDKLLAAFEARLAGAQAPGGGPGDRRRAPGR
jgi:hypothetical protein